MDYALTIGMSVEEYWFGDPHLIFRYEERFNNQRKLKEQDMWLLGNYMIRAMESARFNVNGFIEKSSQLIPYPECPYDDLFRAKKELTEEQKQLLEKTRAELSSRGLLREN